MRATRFRPRMPASTDGSSASRANRSHRSLRATFRRSGRRFRRDVRGGIGVVEPEFDPGQSTRQFARLPLRRVDVEALVTGWTLLDLGDRTVSTNEFDTIAHLEVRHSSISVDSRQRSPSPRRASPCSRRLRPRLRGRQLERRRGGPRCRCHSRRPVRCLPSGVRLGRRAGRPTVRTSAVPGAVHRPRERFSPVANPSIGVRAHP